VEGLAEKPSSSALVFYFFFLLICDKKKLANFSQKNREVSKIYTRKKK
jgi:hypothetical protein